VLLLLSAFFLLRDSKGNIHLNRGKNCKAKTKINVKKQNNMTPPKAHYSSITKFKDTEMAGMQTNSSTLVLKMINQLHGGFQQNNQ
jgi:hypothetical protein